jgi:peptidyl-prolyl cis-trans isomerase-like protein 2
LNKKHSVFGKVVGGSDVLALMEQVPSDKSDVPLHDIILKDVIVYMDPFEEFSKNMDEKEIKAKKKQEDSQKRLEAERLAKKARPLDDGSSRVGKYLKVASAQTSSNDVSSSSSLNSSKLPADPSVVHVKKKSKPRGFDFSSW